MVNKNIQIIKELLTRESPIFCQASSPVSGFAS